MKKSYLILMICLGSLSLINIHSTNAQCWNPKDSSYHMGFEPSDTTDFYANWKVGVDTSYYEASWTIYGDSGVADSGKYAIGISEYTKYWLFSRCFNLKADTNYQLSFWYFVGMPELLNQGLYVKIGNSQDSASMNRSLLNLDSITNNNYKEVKIIFSVPATGIYYLGWLPYGNYLVDDSYMFIDNITLGKYKCVPLNPKITTAKFGICKNSGDSIKLDAGSGYSSYLWTTNHELRINRNSYLWVKDTGKYIVKVTNYLGCYGVDSVKISKFGLPHITISTSTSKNYICGNHNLTLNVINLIENDSLTCIWNKGITHTSSLTVDTAGLYSVIVTDTNGCKGYDSIPIIKASKCGVCSGVHDTLDAGFGYTSYQWTTNHELRTGRYLDVTTPGKVVVALSGPGNFTGVDSINIQEYQLPDIDIQTSTGKNYLCGNDSLRLNVVNLSGTGIITHKWNNNDSLQPYFYAHSDGQYTVLCADSNGCKNRNTVNIQSSPVLNLTISATNNKLFCYGENIDVIFNAHITNRHDSNYTFTWFPADIIRDSVDTVHYAANWYYIATSKTTNCSYTSDTIPVIHHPYPSQELCMATTDTTLNENVVLWNDNVGQGIKYYIIYLQNIYNTYDSIGAVAYDNTSYFIDNKTNPAERAARYKISAVDSCGNKADTSSFVKTIHLTCNLGTGGENNLIWDDYVGFPISYYNIYRFTDANRTHDSLTSIQTTLNSFTDLNPVANHINYYILEAVPVGSGCYSEVGRTKSSRGYKSTFSNTISDKSTGINELGITNYELGIKIYPNPVNSMLIVSYQLSQKSNVSLKVYDVLGNELLTLANGVKEKGNYKITYNTENLKNGIYLVKFIIGDSLIVKKITKI